MLLLSCGKNWACMTFSGHFFFRFNSETECESVLEGGPWYIAGKPIILRKWRPGLKFDKEAVKTIPVWCIFSYLPLRETYPSG